MADNERDAKLILRAEDQASKTFDSVAKSIANVRDQLQQQAKAAASGQGSLNDLTSSYNDLKAAGDALVKQQAAINTFTKTSEAADKTAARVDIARKALEAYQGKLSGQDKVTDAQTTKLTRLQNAVDKLTDSYNKQQARVDKAKDTLDALGLSADKADEQLTATANSARLVAAGLVEAQTAIANYDEGLKLAAAAAEELAARNALLSKAAKLGIDTSQIEDIGTLAAVIEREQIAVDRLTAAENAEAAASRIRRQELISTAKEIQSGNPILEEQFALLEKLSAEERQANGFRQLGTDAVAAADDLGRFGTTSTAAQASITRLADAIRQTVQPAVAEVQTLDGALKQVDESSSLAGDAQKQRVSQYQDSLNKLSQAQAAFIRQAQNIDAYKAQEAELARLESELGEAANKVRSLGEALAQAGPDSADLAKQLAAARRELESVGSDTQNAGTKLEQLGIALKRVGINVNDVDGEFSRLQAGAARSAEAADVLTAKVGGNGTGFLGLKPYELQNLGYQINDVFTSLASGISPTQTLAQQGGQIAQIFPNVLAQFVKLLPVLLPVGVAIGVVADAIHRVNTETEAQRDFSNLFTLAGQQATYSAKQFATVQVALQDIGYSADDSRKTLTEFFNDGLNPENLQTFLFVSQQLANTLKIDLPDAANLFGKALSGGAQQLDEFQSKTHLLNDAQLDQINAFLRSGDVVSAHNALLQDAYERTSALAQAQTPLSDGLHEVETSFRSFVDAIGGFLSRSGLIQGALQGIAGAIRTIQVAAGDAAHFINTFLHPLDTLKQNYNFILGKTSSTGPTLPGINTPLTTNNRINAVAPRGNANNNQRTNSTPALEQQIDDLNEAAKATKKLSDAQSVQLAGQKAVDAAIKANSATGLAQLSAAALARVRAAGEAAEQAKVDQQNAQKAKAAESAADKAAREAETRQNKILALTKELQDAYTKFTPSAAIDPYKKLQDDAATAVNDIQAKFAKLKALGVTTVDGKTEQDFIAQVNAYEQIQEAQQRQVDAEKDLNALLEQRKTALAEIEDKVTSGALSPVQGLEASKAVLDQFQPLLVKAGDAALAAARAVQSINPSPDAAKNIASVQKQVQSFSDAANKTELKAISTKDIKTAFDQLDALTSARDEYIKLENQLVAAGLETSTDAQKKIAQAYKDTTPAILNQVKAVQAIIDQGYLQGTVTFEQYQKLSAQLKLTAGDTQHLTATQVELKNAATNALSTGISTFLTSVGDSIADAIRGTKSLKDVFEDIGKAALSFAASFTEAVAQAIIKIVALQAAQAIIKNIGFSAIGLHEGGVVGTDTPTFRRQVPSAVFAGAVRYHTGGLVGLRPDEVPAILQKGEEVITAADPRNRMNGGLQPQPVGGSPNIKIVNTIDPAEVISHAANTDVGQRAIINVLGDNAQAVRAKLGIA